MRTRLELAGVTKRFGARQVLNQVWLHVRSAEVVGLVGRNGAGKTTLLRIAAGLVRPDGGCVRYDRSGSSIRYFGGEMTLPPTLRGRGWASLFGMRIDEKRRIGELSRGTRQMLGLRVVLSTGDADVVLLDEPWEGLDSEGSAWLIDRLREWQASGSAILLSSHRLHELDSVCTRLVMLQDGRCEAIVRREARQAGVP